MIAGSVSSVAPRSRPVALACAAAPPSDKPIPPHVKMLAGMAGGVTEACALQPLDTTKTRLQLDSAGRYKGMFNCAGTIAKEEGYLALYKGLTPFVTHLTLKYALRFGSFAWFKQKVAEMAGGQSPRVNFSAGLMAGVLEAIIIVTPFEVVKTRLQKEHGKGRYTGPIHCAKSMVQAEGMGALWKGLTPTMVRQGSNQACNFMAFSWLNRTLYDKVDGDGKRLAPWQTFTNGIMAGALGPCMNCPMDVVKTRLMAQETVAGAAGPKYSGFFNCLTTVAREEGVAALWKGLIPRLARLAPGQGITWTVVMRVQSWYESR